MKLRTKLILSFFFLAVLPLAGISMYSYFSSIRAFRRVVESECSTTAEEMSRRMEAAKRDLSRRVQRLSAFPFADLMAQQGKPGGPGDNGLYERLLSQMGESANMVESLEFTPAVPVPSHDGKPARIPFSPRPPLPPPPGMMGGLVIQFPNENNGGPPGGMNPLTRKEGDRVVIQIRVPRAPDIAAEISRQGEAFHTRDSQAQKNGSAAQPASRAQSSVAPQFNSGDLSKSVAELQASVLEERRRLLHIWKSRDFGYDVHSGGARIGTVRAQVSPDQMLQSVLARARHSKGEIPFAFDPEGRIHAVETADLARLKPLEIAKACGSETAAASQTVTGNWLIVTRKDPDSGFVFGMASQLGDGLEEIRRTAARNLAYGFGMVGLALLGILPISSRITRNLTVLTASADHLAQGNLETRVPVRSNDEFGQLALAFNRMAQDLSANQQHLVEQERLRKELEMCRRIQEELLPRNALRSGIVEAKGISIPAREVGGDFFNYFQLAGGSVALLVGDVSGKGLPAALLMANLQATLHARLPLELDLARLAEQLDRDLHGSTPAELYVTLFVGILDTQQQTLRYINAGHNPQYALRSDGVLERLESTGRPIGLLPGGGYEEKCIHVAAGDSLFFYTDGLTEAENGSGEEFGIKRLEQLIVAERAEGVNNILAHLEAATREHMGSKDAFDDATMMLVKIG